MTNYLYYKKNYRGTLFDGKTDFEKYSGKAEKYIKSVINPDAKYKEEELCDCICAVAEQLFENGDFRSVSGESVDGYSVTYSDSFSSRLYDTLKLYLPKELLYRGF